MKHFLLPIVFMVALSARQLRADLDGDIRSVLSDKLLQNASAAIQVVELADGPADDRLLYRYNSSIPLIPASNMKVVTSSALLDKLGKEFRYRTLLVLRDNDLILIGDGDPTFGDAELLKKAGWTPTTVYRNWAAELKKQGISAIRNVLVDDSVFDTVFYHPRWDPKQSRTTYSAEIAGMTLNTGVIELSARATGAGQPARFTLTPPTRYVSVTNSCVGGKSAVILDRLDNSNKLVLKGTCPVNADASVEITIHDPALFAATVLADTLAANGVRITGRIERDRTIRVGFDAAHPPEGYSLIAVHETPLLTALARANKDSVNPYAESFCKRLGFAATGKPGSWENGPAAAEAFLKRIGVSEREFHLDDGCGLSRDNRVSANTLVQILRHNHHSADRDAFLKTLAVGGEDGTLDERFKTDLRSRVFAKTGYIGGVSALSGYLKTRNGRWYVFSILMNGLPAGTDSRAKQLQESIVRAVDRNSP